MIHTEDRENVRILRMEHGKVSAMDLELCQALTEAAHKAGEDEVGAVVLTGTGSSFSAGVDLFRILKEGRDYVEAFLPALTDCLHALFALERPVVGAINGHAIAGGCILACCCDIKLMADGKGRVGVPELKVGVPFPLIGLEIMRFCLPSHQLQTVILGGATFGAEESLRRGLVDEIIPAESLLDESLARAASMAAIPARTFGLTKRELRAAALSRLQSRADLVDRKVAARWSEDSTMEVIQAYLDRTLGKK